MKKLIKKWLGIEGIETSKLRESFAKRDRAIRELENDASSIMSKQLDDEEIPITPDVPFIDDDVFEYVEGSAEGYKWWVIWNCGFAGPFNEESDALSYKQAFFTNKGLIVNVCKLNRYYMQERNRDGN